jgi:ribosomal protein L14E/L6E/L27E
MDIHISDIVVCLSGRDRGKRLLVLSEDPVFVYLANGKNRRAEKPKKKKRKHVRYDAPCEDFLKRRLLETGKLSNSDIRDALKSAAEITEAGEAPNGEAPAQQTQN